MVFLADFECYLNDLKLISIILNFLLKSACAGNYSPYNALHVLRETRHRDRKKGV